MARRRTPSERDRDIGRQIARKRKAAGLNQEQLASEFQISYQQLSKYELGKSQITYVMHTDMVALLDRRYAQLHGLSEEEVTFTAPSPRQMECEKILELMKIAAAQVTEAAERLRKLSGDL